MSQGVELGASSLCDLLLNDVVLSLKVGCVKITGGACTDKYGDEIYLPSIFEPGSAGTTWTNEEKDSSALVVQYEDGMKVWPSKYAHLNMAYRMVQEIN